MQKPVYLFGNTGFFMGIYVKIFIKPYTHSTGITYIYCY